MEDAPASLNEVGSISKQIVRRLATIGENRLELLTLEMQEERDRILCALLMALGIATFGLLAGMMLSAAIVVWLWTWSPVAILFILAVCYALAGAYLYHRLKGLFQDWQMLSASLDQLRKDRESLDTLLK